MKVLDKGFVQLIDTMPHHIGNTIDPITDPEFAILEAARISTGGNASKGYDKDIGLLRYLYKHKHTSPFEMVEFKFKIKLPIFVARQWVRHRTANINEFSARYAEMTDDFYYPEKIGKQDDKNKQGSKDEFSPQFINQFNSDLEQSNRKAYKQYKDWLEDGVARETARLILPLNTYTVWMWKIDLHNLLHFLRLRLHPHAQYEIRCYAETIKAIITPLVPNVMKLFEEEINGTTS